MEKTEFISSLEEIIHSELFLTDRTDKLDEEIAQNCHWISLDGKLVSEIQADELLDGLRKVRENRLTQLSESAIQSNLTYYSWFDEQACQLRFNIINTNHATLPFGAKINVVDDESTIVKAFISSKYHEGIPWEDFEELEVDTANTEDQGAEFQLDVYLEELKKN